MLSNSHKKKLLQILKEDIGQKDVTSALLESTLGTAKIIAKENATLSGIEEAIFLLEKQGCKVQVHAKNGEPIKQKQTIITAFGKNKKILQAERTVLNVLGRMSGIATICKKATKIANGKTKIYLTRKTAPGFNEFDKKASLDGGAYPHRINLEEMILIKDNHLEFESIETLLKKANKEKQKTKTKKVEIEVENLNDAILAAKNKADIIMLDNFSFENAKKTIRKIKKINPQIKIELSGGINLNNLAQYSKLKPDLISMGQLTKEAKMIDFSMEIKKATK